MPNVTQDCSPYTFYFQMADGKGRIACAVTVNSPDRDQAESVFRCNSDAIVQMAREHIANGLNRDGPVRLRFATTTSAGSKSGHSMDS